MNKIIIGTAGHVDHGKTSLIKALTGIDCDRWAEEKTRGITLDLGFAHLTEGSTQLSFVDVPGHERFLHNALAGLGGIRTLLLVIDVQEGVRPQTIEHLEIARLLGIEQIIIAASKIDSADAEWVDLVSAEIREFISKHGYLDAPIHRVSAVTGEGLEDLKADLLRAGEQTQADHRPVRLPVDRAFQVLGRGSVVTASPAAGQVAEGAELSINGSASKVKVRQIEVHGQPRPTASVGERIALQISGAHPDQVPRGTQLVEPDGYLTSKVIAGQLTLLSDAPDLESTRDVRLHLFSADLAARVRPLAGTIHAGETGWVELIIGQRTAIAVGDRAILRRPSPASTLGGLVVVDPAWRRPRGQRMATALALLKSGDDGLMRWWAADKRSSGVSTQEVARRLGQPAELATVSLKRLTADGHLIELHGEQWAAPQVIKELSKSAATQLDEFHRAQPLEPGMPKAEFIRRLLPSTASPQAHLDLLASMQLIEISGQYVRRPQSGSSLNTAQKTLANRLAQELDDLGFTVPSPAELARKLDAKPQVIEGLLHYLMRQGTAVKLPSGLWLSASTIQRTLSDLQGSGWQSFTVGEFKGRYGLSRKWAIPLLEHFDSMGATARQGDGRILTTTKQS